MAIDAFARDLVTPTEMLTRDRWARKHLLGQDLKVPAVRPADTTDPAAPGSALPSSFVYDGKPSDALLATWPRTITSNRLDKRRTQYTIVWSDPKTGLEVRCVAVDYSDYPALEWTVYFKNTGATNTAVLENIQGLDAMFVRDEKGEFVLHGNYADVFDYNHILAESYKPFELVMGPGAGKRFAPVGGRPTNGPDGWPYYNLAMPGGGILLAVGWPGQWSTSFQRDAGKGLRITAGQERTHLSLAPGEEIRSPLVVLMFWEGGDTVEAQNLWRRWMLAHNVPRIDGKLPEPILVVGPAKPLGQQDEASCRQAIDTMDATGATVLWVDAGWYPCDPAKKLQFLWWGTGDWRVDPVRFPNGFKALSDSLHAKGRRFLLWFDPERIGDPDCWVLKTHPEWVLGKVLLDLSNPEVRRWITDQVEHLITEQGIDIYRQDFNVFPGPLDHWRRKDGPDRQGMTENLYVQGYLAFWDELRSKHPRLLIDSCASGGRRNDLETLRRSVPLYRTDTYEKGPATAVASQGHTVGLSSWVPFYGSGGHVTDPYTMRSFYMPSFAVWGPRDEKLAAQARAEWAKVAPLMLGDLYPLTPWSLQGDQWLAWQFNRPEGGDGVVQAFRRDGCEQATMTFRLSGLDPATQYEITDLDAAGKARATGRELVEKGLTVEIKAKPGAAVVTYRKVE